MDMQWGTYFFILLIFSVKEKPLVETPVEPEHLEAQKRKVLLNKT